MRAAAQVVETAHPRRLFPLPRAQELGREDRQLLRAIDNAVEALAHASVHVPEAGLSGGLPSGELESQALRHPLSPHFPPIAGGFARCSRSEIEWATLRAAYPSIAPALDSGGGGPFTRALGALASAMTGSATLRCHDVRTSADQGGHFVRFPPSDLVEPRLAQIAAMVGQARRLSPALAATVALVSLTHCHPFPDGNGRTARILFNALLQGSYAAPRFYLPLYELAALSRGGYIVRVRQAELRREWTPLFSYVLSAVEYWTEVLARASKAEILLQ